MKYVLVYEITTKDPIPNLADPWSWPFKVSITCEADTEVTGAQINDGVKFAEHTEGQYANPPA